ncbi:MAG: YhcH/YjgK/YiaL family protein [Sphaerochaetaceae bacterium]|nr:YhcH/YjgK/YiaL family protein [Sphaerochaetaceae bacterium]
MISVKNGLEYKYDFTAKKFQLAFEFLKRKDLASLPEGTIELGEGVRASIQHYSTFKYEDNMFETHEKYFDVQYVIEGQEMIAVCNRDQLGEVSTPYSVEKDITFYEEPKCYSQVFLDADDYVVLAPEDAHKPRCIYKVQMPIKKVVIKVPV